MPIVPIHLVDTHAEFFFPDGNLVLIAGAGPTLAFRLHRGIVNRWSPVFSGMIDALDAASDPWTFLGCGVLVFEEDPVDFERLIRVLYDGTASLDCSPTDFPLLASLLRLSHKYNIPNIQAHTLTHVLTAYPLTLSAWDAREAYDFSPMKRQDRLRALRAQRPHPLAVVSLALQLGAAHLLVPAYLDLARFPVSEIIRGYTLLSPSNPSSSPDDPTAAATPSPGPPTLHLPIQQTTAVLRGKETLQRFIADFIKASVENRTQSPLCRYIHMQVPGGPLPTPPYPCSIEFARISHEMLVMTAGVAGGIDSDPLFVLKCAVEILKEGAPRTHAGIDVETGDDQVSNSQPEDREEAPQVACAACIESFKQTVDVARQHIWNSLPKWFDLKRFIEGGFEAGWE